MKRLWTIKEVAHYLNVEVQTIYQWRTKGYGPRGARVGKHIRWDPDEVETWFRDQIAEVA